LAENIPSVKGIVRGKRAVRINNHPVGKKQWFHHGVCLIWQDGVANLEKAYAVELDSVASS
jgi:hypothetical protein